MPAAARRPAGAAVAAALVAAVLLASAPAAADPRASSLRPEDEERSLLPSRLAAVDSLLAAGSAEAALAAADRLGGRWGDDAVFGWQIDDRRALALAALGRKQEALPLLERAVQRNPFVAGAHRNLALALAGLGRRGRALAEYAQAAELEPRNPTLRLEHAQYLADFRQWRAAAAEFEVAAGLCGGCPAAQGGLGRALLQLDRPGDAVAPLRAAWTAAPDTSVRRLLVSALHRAGRDSALLALLDGEDPAAWTTQDHLVRIEAEGRRGGPAPRSLAYAEDLATGREAPAVAGSALFWGRVALNLLQAEAWAPALAAADRSVALAPDNAVYRNNRVVLLLRLGRREEAAAEWERVLALDPSLKEQARP